MKVMQLYNNYVSGGGGETTMVHSTEAVLTNHGHQVETIIQDNHNIVGIAGKLSAFANGIYSLGQERLMLRRLDEFKPDIVHIWNLYPLFSPSVIAAAKKRRIPVVMSVQNYQLSCPTASHFSHGEVCTRCISGGTYECVAHNCKSNVAQSVGYALRSLAAAKAGWYAHGVGRFLVVSDLVKTRMLACGYSSNQIEVVPNSVPVPPRPSRASQGSYVGFVGRLTPEKGLDVLLEAARISGVPIQIAGDGPDKQRLAALAPQNVTFAGSLDRSQVVLFYANARVIVVPSVWDEPFGLVAPEAMSHGLAVIAARSGGLQDIVLDNVTGRLYERHDSGELARYLTEVWNSRELSTRFGAAGYERVVQEYSAEAYYKRLVDAYTICLNGSVLPA